MQADKDEPVGVIGLGLMGSVLAGRLRAAGFAVTGFDIDPAKAGRLAALGGRTAASIAELARAANPIVLAVFDTDQVEEVVERAILPALSPAGRHPGKIVLCASTCDPDRVAALAPASSNVFATCARYFSRASTNRGATSFSSRANCSRRHANSATMRGVLASRSRRASMAPYCANSAVHVYVFTTIRFSAGTTSGGATV